MADPSFDLLRGVPLFAQADDRFLEISKGRLALALEIFANDAAQPFLDHMVRIEKGQAKTPRQLTPDG